MKQFIFILIMIASLPVLGQCNQHVFSSVGAEKWTNFQYQDCDGLSHYFGLPAGGYTIIYCAEISTAFVLNGDGFVYPLLQEHPSYASCVQLVCQGDFDEDGIVGVNDLQVFLSNYGLCEN